MWVAPMKSFAKSPPLYRTTYSAIDFRTKLFDVTKTKQHFSSKFKSAANIQLQSHFLNQNTSEPHNHSSADAVIDLRLLIPLMIVWQ